ncbi:MAG TPA: hypothetical protein VI548_09150 [Chitinophagaceae bacterium]|nr:hypothetical protein [Chitinophagaceae bacterium]
MNKISSDLYSKKGNNENDIDYSAIYRLQENKQLTKRLKKTRNALFISAFAVLLGALVFWMMTNTLFTSTNFLLYLAFAIILVLLGFYSKKRPFVALIIALILCVSFSAIELFLNKADDLLVEGAIHKLFIISLLSFTLPSSKEAELIRRELKFS